MSDITVVRYHSEQEKQWSTFVSNARNGVFLFNRYFMDYHSDRFDDCSLMVFEGKRLLALLPLNQVNDQVVSHGGLTYGGVIADDKMTSNKMIELFAAVSGYLLEQGIHCMVYKAIPHIYHDVPTQEDLYALTLLGAQLIRRDLSSAIDFNRNVKMSKGRKYQINQARKADIAISEETDFGEYWKLLTEVVGKHGAKPTHSLAEIEVLAARFPQEIRLYTATKEDQLEAGVVVFDNGNVIHTQYMASSEFGRDSGALDLIIATILEQYKTTHRYFSFGISTENAGRRLNTGLIRQKESFGARAITHDFYLLNLSEVGSRLEASREQ
jgi:hypothetical protein